MHDKALERSDYLVYDKSEDEMLQVPEASNAKKYSVSRYKGDNRSQERVFSDLKRSLGSLNTVKTKIANMFQAKVFEKWLNDRDQGKINNRALARVQTGNNKVFKTKIASKESDTAIMFLVDMSFSMVRENDRHRMAFQSVVLFLETLKLTRIKSAVWGYTTKIPTKRPSEECYSVEYGRVEPLMTYIFKKFDEAYSKKVKNRIGNYINLSHVENCDGENVNLAVRHLQTRKEKRKILFVLCDGYVCSSASSKVGEDYLKKVVENSKKRGVEVIGIAIGDAVKKVSQFYPKHIVVNDVKNLSTKLFEGLRSVLKV